LDGSLLATSRRARDVVLLSGMLEDRPSLAQIKAQDIGRAFRLGSILRARSQLPPGAMGSIGIHLGSCSTPGSSFPALWMVPVP